jgi:probable rRNA maturation factor
MITKKIQFHYLGGRFYLPSRTTLKGFILILFKKEGHKVEAINYIFCSDQYLLKINKDFLDHNTYTDIITFQYTAPKLPVQSDIYISIDRVKENARRYHTSFVQELYRVIFHGALHLCGYKDKSDKDVKLMRTKEDFYLAQYVSRETKRMKGSNI